MRALFRVHEEKRHVIGEGAPRTYMLVAVTPQGADAEDPEIQGFWAATPNGKIELFTVNPAAQLVLGETYYVDFTLRPSAA